VESTPEFTIKARAFIAVVSAAGLPMLAAEVHRWSSGNILRFLAYLALSLIASTLKVQLPGTASTMSPSFLFVLIGIASFTLSETLVVGCSAALMQTFWRPKHFKPVQGFFNVASWAISVTFSYWLSHLLCRSADPVAILLALSTFLFFASHTGLTAIVISLTAQKPLADTWQSCFLWSFPYYLFGAIIAGLCSASARTETWWPPLLVLPIVYLSHTFYRTCVDRLTIEKAV
jgi:hypothetical protein